MSWSTLVLIHKPLWLVFATKAVKNSDTGMGIMPCSWCCLGALQCCRAPTDVVCGQTGATRRRISRCLYLFPETDQELTFVFNITIDMYMSWLICFGLFLWTVFPGCNNCTAYMFNDFNDKNWVQITLFGRNGRGYLIGWLRYLLSIVLKFQWGEFGNLGRPFQLLNVNLLYLFQNQFWRVWDHFPVETPNCVQVSTI